LEFWNLVNLEEVLSWESLFINIAVLLEVDLDNLDTTKLRKRLDPATSLQAPTLGKLALAIKETTPEIYFSKFIISGVVDSPVVGVLKETDYIPSIELIPIPKPNILEKLILPLAIEPPLPQKLVIKTAKVIPNIISPSIDSQTFLEQYAKADTNDPLAQYYLGSCYYIGINVERNLDQAISWFRKSASYKYAQAEYLMGVYYQYGFGTDDHCNNEEAFFWYRRAAHGGNCKAMCHLGLHYLTGPVVIRSIKKSIEWYEKASEFDDPEAFNELGYFYLNGNGVKKDLVKAAFLFSRSADLGYDYGMYNNGFCLMTGTGTRKNQEMGIVWYIRAANAGNVSAMNSLGVCYRNGTGVNPDYPLAFEIFKSACMLDSTLATHNLAYCYEHGIGTKVNCAEALKYYLMAAEKGNLESQYRVGYMYKHGIGTAVDLLLAKAW
jgi:TPR repeat protein